MFKSRRGPLARRTPFAKPCRGIAASKTEAGEFLSRVIGIEQHPNAKRLNDPDPGKSTVLVLLQDNLVALIQTAEQLSLGAV